MTARQLLSHTFGEGPQEPFVYNAERFGQLSRVMEWCAPQPYRKSVAHRIINRLAMTDLRLDQQHHLLWPNLLGTLPAVVEVEVAVPRLRPTCW